MYTFNNIRITTERLVLRPLQADDAEAAYAIRSTTEVMRYGASLPWTSMDTARDWIVRAIADTDSNTNLRLAIEKAEDHTMIGSCTFFQIDAQCRRAEIGYELNPAYWGKGYMNEALRALLHFGFTELKLNRIEADIHPDNASSAKSLERLGFTKEGHLRERWIVGDEVSDSIIYGLLLRDWQTKKS